MKFLPVSNLLAFAFPLIGILGYVFQRPWLVHGIMGGFVVLVQILDPLSGRDPKFPWKDVRANIKQPDATFPKENVILYLYVLTHLSLLALGVWQFAETSDPLPWILMAIPISLSGGNVLNVAHELWHGSTRLDMFMGRVAAVPAFWTVHEYEHLYLHHHDEVICTEEDTSFAKLGQNFYSYCFTRGFVSNYQHAWEVQEKMLEARGRKLVGLRIFAGTYLPSIVLAVLVAVLFGVYALVFFLLQAFMSIVVYLLGTYNQHYGLTRRKRPDGRYEPFTFMNIWSADQRLTNRVLWNLGRHAHHHLDPFCSYTDLKIIDKSPLLPHGNMTTLAISLIPPLWFKMMNPRVAEVFARRDQLEAQGQL